MSLESYSAEKNCRIYTSGKTCKFGRNCRFRHSRNIETSRDGILNQSTEQTSCEAGVEDNICFNYAKNRFCKFGARCRFSHQIPRSFESRENNHQHAILSSNTETESPSGSEVLSDRPYFSLPLPVYKDDNPNKSIDEDEPKNHDRCVKAPNLNGRNARSVEDDVVKRNPHNSLRKRGRYGRRPANLNDQDGEKQNRKHDLSRTPDSLHHQQPAVASNDNIPTAADDPVEESADGGQQKKHNRSRRRPICRYFKAGNCTAGDECRFWHPTRKADRVLEHSEDKENTTLIAPKEEKIIFARPNEFQLDDFMEEKAVKLRQKEIDQILKRFPKACHAGTDKDGTWSCELMFIPTDPDWVYDLKEVLMKVILPITYPLMPMTVLLSGDQEQMPSTVYRFTGKSIKEWIEGRFRDFKSRGKGELMFLPFVHWLDRSLEGILTDGLRLYRRELVAAASGIQLISGAELQEEYAKKQEMSSEEDGSNISGDDDEEDDEEEYDDEFPPAQPSHVGELPPVDDLPNNSIASSEMDAIRKGTEVKLQKLELAENAATMKLRKVKVIIQCLRCRDRAEVSTPVGKLNSVTCGKCSQAMLLLFRASMVHQFSAIAGYLDLENCSAFDLVLMDCTFEVGCFNCNRDMRMEGLLTGQPKETFCHQCHKKIKIATESIRFQQLQATNVFDASDARIIEAAKKTKKLPKDPAIQPGKPLPGEGTCKHYKKSYRWLRFPCCGKAFPCDICHDESEGDHEMARANRMICGFCCREQPYSAEKPCVECGYNLVKKSSSHWEGGKGCRDKIKMSRDDVKKFTNMNKTVSKRSQAKKDANKGKKNTKLRHA